MPDTAIALSSGAAADSPRPGSSIAGSAVFILARAGGTGELVGHQGEPQMARQFRDQGLASQVAQVLARTGFDPAQLEVELTESMLIADFGTGHSSLRDLTRFHVNTLKIDRSFVKDTPDDPEDSAIATAVIAPGHGLGLHVVAEGVETPQQVHFLRSRGCDEFQGFLLSRPLAAPASAAWLARHEAAQAEAV